MIKNYITEIILFLTGGGLMQLLNYFRQRKKDESDEYNKLLDYYKKMLKELKISEQECKNMIYQLQQLYTELKAKVMILESTHLDFPFPMILKSLEGKIISINQEFENFFLKPLGKEAIDFIGKPESELWPTNQMEDIIVADRKALNSLKGYWSGEQEITYGNNKIVKCYCIKYINYINKTPIGIGSIYVLSEN